MSPSPASNPSKLLSALARETYDAERNVSASNPGPQNLALVKSNPKKKNIIGLTMKYAKEITDQREKKKGGIVELKKVFSGQFNAKDPG